MVSVARSQVKRSVSASVAGHEVRVSARQHTHHLCREDKKKQSLEETGSLFNFLYDPGSDLDRVNAAQHIHINVHKLTAEAAVQDAHLLTHAHTDCEGVVRSSGSL